MEQCDDDRGIRLCHPGHRLVEEQQARLGGERNGKLKLALLTMRQAAGRNIFAPRKADFGENGARRLAQGAVSARGAPEAEAVSAMGLDRQRDVVQRAELAAQRRNLKRAGEAALRACRHAERSDVLAGEADASGRRRDLAGELGDEGRLTGAVGTDHRMQFAFGDRQREIVGRRDAAESLDEIFGGEERFSHRSPTC